MILVALVSMQEAHLHQHATQERHISYAVYGHHRFFASDRTPLEGGCDWANATHPFAHVLEHLSQRAGIDHCALNARLMVSWPPKRSAELSVLRPAGRSRGSC